MVSKHTMMRLFSAAANASRITSLAERRYGGAGTIFMLHSIVSDQDFLPRENIHTSAGFLDAMIRHYLRHRIPIVSLSEAMERLKSRSRHRFVCFTFDDGYRDNLTLALPIFRKHGVPFSVYVSNAFLDRNYPEYWWGQLRHLVMDHDIVAVDSLPKPLATSTAREKIAAYHTLRKLMDSGRMAEAERNDLFSRYGISVVEALDRDSMTAAELKAAAEAEPLLEIGGHTLSHNRLAQLDEVTAYDEICRNKAAIEALIDRPLRHFAYPYGDADSCGERDFELVRKAGYDTATTTRLGNLFPAHLESRWSLPRMRFIGPCESVPFMEAQRSGAFTAAVSGFGNPVVTL
ncbi:MAG TPA: polysaccharide deacetylase family protein [Asticcacaulis sp.]|nr:polysaccharide deacetylase family protein [Asticcacaulis sp.]